MVPRYRAIISAIEADYLERLKAVRQSLEEQIREQCRQRNQECPYNCINCHHTKQCAKLAAFKVMAYYACLN